MAQHIIKLLPKQKAFVLEEAQQVLYSGAFGAGKSYAVCVKCVVRAQNPMAREGLVRKHMSDFVATTLKTLLHGDGETPPVLPPGSYEHIKSEKRIILKGGGEIIYFSLDDQNSVVGHNLTGVGVDQAEELDIDDYTHLLGRMRSKGAGIKRQIYMACNPDSPSHHLAIRFALAPDVTIPMQNCVAITTKSTDNTHLPQDYIDLLNTFTGVRRKRFVEGIWAGSDELVYDNWQRDKHVVRYVVNEADIARVFIGVDDATSVPFAALRIVKLKSGRKIVQRMVYQRNMLMDEKVEAIRAMGPLDLCVVDPAASALKLHLRAAGFVVHDGINPVNDGIQEVAQCLAPGPDGLPMLLVDPSCTDLIREMETYERKKTKDGRITDEVVKENDHAVDALRYVCMEDRIPVSAAVDRRTVSSMAKKLPEERKPLHVGYIEPRMPWGPEAEAAIRFKAPNLMEFRIDHEQPEVGDWKLWCELPDDRPRTDRTWVVAASVGTGAPGSRSVIKVGDAETRDVVAECVLHNAPPVEVAQAAIAAALWFVGIEGPARLIWNHMGGGVGFGEYVRQMRYGNVYRSVSEGQQSDEPGWRYSAQGMVALLSNLQAEIRLGKYREATPQTIVELQRWAYDQNGTVSPVSQGTESSDPKTASDRALAAMLLSHAFRWVERIKPAKPKIEHGSMEWLEAREKGLVGQKVPRQRSRR